MPYGLQLIRVQTPLEKTLLTKKERYHLLLLGFPPQNLYHMAGIPMYHVLQIPGGTHFIKIPWLICKVSFLLALFAISPHIWICYCVSELKI